MKHTLRIKIPILCFAACIHFKVKAQQNFINVPSGDATAKGGLFFQQQVNVDKNIQGNTTLDLGLGKGFEVGCNVLGLNADLNKGNLMRCDTGSGSAYNPLVMVNGLKSFSISHHVSLVAGTQVGGNVASRRHATTASLFYGNVVLSDLGKKELKIVSGVYYNSRHYGGGSNRLGAWLGMEINAGKKTHLVLESIIGNQSLSYTSLAMVYFPKVWMPVTAGLQIPNNRQNPYSFVVELTLLPRKKMR